MTTATFLPFMKNLPNPPDALRRQSGIELIGTNIQKMTIDLTILDNEPEALAKITEALAKVYFDNVLKKGYNLAPIEQAYSTCFKLCPNYRLILKDKPGFEKYIHLTEQMAEITSLPIK